jgi:isopenicillin N synthase-like dioxygenase
MNGDNMIIYTSPEPAQYIPIIDIADSYSPDLEKRRAVAMSIHRAARDTGFFYIKNHGIAQRDLDDILDIARQFFALPMADKMALNIANSEIMRGYEPMALQTLDTEPPPDLKEAFTSGRELGADHPFVRNKIPFEGANQWPASLPQFRDSMLSYNDKVTALGRHLCRSIALSLDLPEDYFESDLAEPSSSVRLLHYPPHPADAEPYQLGAGTHTDWGLITLLLQDIVGGLEVRNADGKWLRDAPVEGTFIVNLAYLVPRITNGLYHSTLYRVLNNVSGRDRYSVATFFNPSYMSQFDVVPTCRPDNFAPAPWTFGEHIQDMLNQTYGKSA